MSILTIAGVQVEIDRKDIKNLHLSVHPPVGRVRIAVPLLIGDEAVKLAVINKLGWIKRQQRQLVSQARQSERHFVTGETHYFWGRKFRLNVIEGHRYGLAFRGKAKLDFHVRKGSETEHREAYMHEFSRELLREHLAHLVDSWSKTIGVKPSGWQIRRMKTKWGSCNTSSGHLLFNLELIKKPHRCIEYIVVHELVHLLERHHGERFVALMDKYLPAWRACRVELNAAPLAYEGWEY